MVCYHPLNTDAARSEPAQGLHQDGCGRAAGRGGSFPLNPRQSYGHCGAGCSFLRFIGNRVAGSLCDRHSSTATTHKPPRPDLTTSRKGRPCSLSECAQTGRWGSGQALADNIPVQKGRDCHAPGACKGENQCRPPPLHACQRRRPDPESRVVRETRTFRLIRVASAVFSPHALWFGARTHRIMIRCS